MKLLRLVLDNFRGAPNGEYAFTHPTTGAPLDTIYVTGPAASGKTTFLTAIAALKESVGAYDAPPDPARLLRRGATRGRVAGTWLLTPEEMALAEVERPTIEASLDLGEGLVPELSDAGLRALFERYSHDPAQGKLEYFPANRRLANGRGMKPDPLSHEASLRAGASPDKYASIKQSLIDLALADGVSTVMEAKARGILLKSDTRDSLAPYRKDLAELSPGIRLAGVEMRGEEPELFFERPDGARLVLEELSDSEKQALLFGVTYRRIGLSRSVVLIDQPELYLHTDLQLRFVQALGRLGVDNQTFFATGSPEITRVAAAHQIIALGGGRKA